MVSNAFLRSIKRVTFVEPLLMLRYQLSMASRRAVRVEWSGLQPDWNLIGKKIIIIKGLCHYNCQDAGLQNEPNIEKYYVVPDTCMPG